MRATNKKGASAVRVAAMFALVAIGVATWLLWGGPRGSVVAGEPSPITDAARTMLASLRGSKLTAVDDPAEAVRKAREALTTRVVAESLERRLPEGSSEDLRAAFAERLGALLDPSAERDAAALARRGDPRTAEDLASQYEANAAVHESDRRAGFAWNEMRVRVLSGPHAQPAELPERDLGRLTLSIAGPRSHVPMDPVAEGWTVAEVVLPMSRETLGVTDGRATGDLSGKRSAVLAGYRFAWSTSRRCWIAYESIVYSDPNERYFPLPGL